MIENAHNISKHGTTEIPTGARRLRNKRGSSAKPPRGRTSFVFSLLIITLSFVPVFTLEAQEGKLFGPLAFTKTYSMAAAAVFR